jgi:replicative DNA helicase
MTERPLPANTEAEQATIGSVFLDRDSLASVAGFLQPGHFYSDKHATIYAAQLACYAKRTPPDLVTVAEVLRQNGTLDGIGGVAYLAELSNSVPTATHIEYYGRIVEGAALHRRLIQAGSKIAALGYNGGDDIETAEADAQAVLTSALQRSTTNGLVSLSDSVDVIWNKLTNGVQPGIPTGLQALDESHALGGLHRKRVILLAAPPGTGKTIFSGQIAYNVAKAAAHEGDVVWFSLEMTAEELTERMLALHTGIDAKAIAEGRLDEGELQRVTDAMGFLQGLPIHIDETPGLSSAEIRLKTLQHMARRGRPSLVIVDHVLLVKQPVKKNTNEAQEVDTVVRELKNLSKEVDAPVLAIHQMNRDGYDSELPSLRNLYMGGEKDSDVVMFLTRPDMNNPQSPDKDKAKIVLAKHRGGPTGVIELLFRPNVMRFADISKYEAVPGY